MLGAAADMLDNERSVLRATLREIAGLASDGIDAPPKAVNALTVIKDVASAAHERTLNTDTIGDDDETRDEIN